MDKKYLRSHEWIKKIEDKIYELGISDYAQVSLGDIVFVDLPNLGKKLEAGKEFCTIESVKAASDLYSPVNGEILEVNEDLKDNPDILNEDAENIWIVRLRSSDTNIEGAMNEKEYEDFVKSEEEDD